MQTDLLQQFHQNAKIHFDIDYSDKGSVKRGNKAANRLFEIAEELNASGNTMQLVKLLELNEYKVNLWVAHILLEKLNADGQIADKALRVIREYASSDDLNAYGEKLWLEKWQKTKR